MAELFGTDIFSAAHLAYEWPRADASDSNEEDQARYHDILTGLEYISDEGLSLLEDQIRYVLRARYPRRARPNRGGDAGETDGGED